MMTAHPPAVANYIFCPALLPQPALMDAQHRHRGISLVLLVPRSRFAFSLAGMARLVGGCCRLRKPHLKDVTESVVKAITSRDDAGRQVLPRCVVPPEPCIHAFDLQI